MLCLQMGTILYSLILTIQFNLDILQKQLSICMHACLADIEDSGSAVLNGRVNVFEEA